MALTRAQLLMGNSSQGVVLTGQVQGVRQGVGVIIAADGTISFDPTTATGVLKTNNPSAYNAYVWPTTLGAVGQQLQLGAAGALSWEDPDQIPWTAKGQLIVGTGVGTSILLNAGSDTAVLVTDSTTPSGLTYSNSSTAAIQVPAGTTLQQPAISVVGQIRYNTDNDEFEGYLGSPAAWAPIGSVDPASLAEAATGVITTKYSSPETAVPKDASGMTGAAILPAGTTLQRPAVSVDGMFRFNSTNEAFEGYGQNLTAWEALMPTGAATDKFAYLNNQVITTNYTLPAAPIIKNGLSAGPITINASVTVTIPAGQAWSIV